MRKEIKMAHLLEIDGSAELFITTASKAPKAIELLLALQRKLAGNCFSVRLERTQGLIFVPMTADRLRLVITPFDDTWPERYQCQLVMVRRQAIVNFLINLKKDELLRYSVCERSKENWQIVAEGDLETLYQEINARVKNFFEL